MVVEYVLTVEDYVACFRYHHASQSRLRLNWSWLWLLLLMVVLGVYLVSSLRTPQPEPPPQVNEGQSGLGFVGYLFLAVLILVVVFLVWGRPFLNARLAKRFVTHPDNQKRLLGWRRTSIGPEGLSMRGEDVHLTLAWTAIQRMAVTKEYAFLYMTAQHAIVIPRRPFASDGEFRKFVTTAREYRDMARNAPHGGEPPRPEAVDEPDTNITPDERGER
jgi:hypothetical protein